MVLTGVFANCGAIIVGALLGTFIIKNISERFNDIILKAVGLCVLYIGISGTLKNENVILLILSMIIGSILGEAIDIDGKMNKLGELAERKLGFGEGNFSKGFVTASILFCVGSMAIVGSLNSGLSMDHDMLFTKSILDGITSVVYGGIMGIGVAFSAIPILIYQGCITLGASFVKDFLTADMIREMSAVGSLIIAGIGFNFLMVKQIKIANMIPAMFIPCVYYGVLMLF